MARIAGIDIPRNKKIKVALTYIHGIGPSTAAKIIANTGVDGELRVSEITEESLAKLRKEIETKYKVEGEVRRDVQNNIKRLIEIGTYRGLRHRLGLPTRGQRTHTNARTRKGRKKTVGLKKSKVGKKG
jgi:small subunit ribosomal protein S13